MIKVGEYIRTPYGKIGKITYIYPHKPYYDDGFVLDNKEFIQCGMKAMKKLESTPNIIDLIEEGDYVNGRKVCCLRKDNCDYDIGFTYNDDWGEWYGIDTDEIETIVTKEQFESMEYKI